MVRPVSMVRPFSLAWREEAAARVLVDKTATLQMGRELALRSSPERRVGLVAGGLRLPATDRTIRGLYEVQRISQGVHDHPIVEEDGAAHEC